MFELFAIRAASNIAGSKIREKNNNKFRTEKKAYNFNRFKILNRTRSHGAALLKTECGVNKNYRSKNDF